MRFHTSETKIKNHSVHFALYLNEKAGVLEKRSREQTSAT